MTDRVEYVKALATQLANGVNDAFKRLHDKPPAAQSPNVHALHLDEFAVACAALKEGFDILGQRASEAAGELLDEGEDEG